MAPACDCRPVLESSHDEGLDDQAPIRGALGAWAIATAAPPGTAPASETVALRECNEMIAFVTGDESAILERVPERYRLARDPASGQPLLFVMAARCDVTVNTTVATVLTQVAAVIESPDGVGCISDTPLFGTAKGDTPNACNWYSLFAATDNPQLMAWLREGTPAFPVHHVPEGASVFGYRRSPAPRLFGRSFGGPMAGHNPLQPWHYDLHAWLWEDNPDGLLAPHNPAVSCPDAGAPRMSPLRKAPVRGSALPPASSSPDVSIRPNDVPPSLRPRKGPGHGGICGPRRSANNRKRGHWLSPNCSSRPTHIKNDRQQLQTRKGETS